MRPFEEMIKAATGRKKALKMRESVNEINSFARRLTPPLKRVTCLLIGWQFIRWEY